jgi:hypothetical protein
MTRALTLELNVRVAADLDAQFVASIKEPSLNTLCCSPLRRSVLATESRFVMVNAALAERPVGLDAGPSRISCGRGGVSLTLRGSIAPSAPKPGRSACGHAGVHGSGGKRSRIHSATMFGPVASR